MPVITDCSNGSLAELQTLLAPARNHYFYGKLLDVVHFQMEQTYFNRKRWLLNRLGLGSGVLCGLEVGLSEDEQRVWINPGVAIDPLGREIIVPARYYLENPAQPTDDCGRPQGDPLQEGTLTLCLAYHECAAEPVPILVSDCDIREDCAPSTIRERYRVLLRANPPEALPGQITDEQCAAIFPHAEQIENGQAVDLDHRLVACETLRPLRDPCPASEETCVVLATITLPVEGQSLVIDSCTYRTVVYSNSLLWELMTCLAARVDDCCRVRILRYVSGDGQQAAPGQPLADPLVVEVVNGDDVPVAGEMVTFRARSGGGTVAPQADATDANGRAQTQWTLGSTVGLQTLEASIASGAHVVFLATAVEEDGPPLNCVDFEDLELETSLRVGESLATSGVTVSARTFFWSNGEATDDGLATVVAGGQAGGTGNEMNVNNINLAFDFGASLAGLSLRFGEYGGNLNLEVNGDLQNFEDFADINGQIIGGVTVEVSTGPDDDLGTLTLRGQVNSFAIGGQEFFIDDVCPAVPDALPPVVNAIWPPNAANILTNDEWRDLWEERPRLAITFDRPMNEEALSDPERLANWLRVWRLEAHGEIVVRRLNLLLEETNDGFAGRRGFTAIYSLELGELEPFQPARYLIQMRAEDSNIISDEATPLLLDAEFSGTQLSSELLETVWQIEERQDFGNRAVWDDLVDTGAVLPRSGDGGEGGRFHSWFELIG